MQVDWLLLLIEPQGIEIIFNLVFKGKNYMLLIEPQGIEIAKSLDISVSIILLIEPQGIEIFFFACLLPAGVFF